VRLLATAWFYLVLVITFPLGWAAGVVIFALTFSFDPHRHLLHRFLSAFCHQYLRCWPGWSVRVTGVEHMPAGPCVLIANHQSMVDILAMMGVPTEFKFVSKIELFSVPLLGFMMKRLGYVALDRKHLRSPEQLFAACGALIDAGQKVLIYPEGTYASGPERLPFRRGAFRLAQLKQVPVVPVVIHGTKELVREDGPMFAARAKVRVEVMPPMQPPSAQLPLDDFVREAEERYAKWLDQSFRHHKAVKAR
jgi:1-acyl-sn-glycerol-3-phosphate acyltransferase